MIKTKDIILTCEHATNFIDPELNNLGLSNKELNMHIAYDKGCKELTQKLAQELGCQYILGTCSRLVCDLNRRDYEDALILQKSDGITIDGNLNISAEDKQKRLNNHYYPYHNKLAKMVANCTKEPFIFSIHSYTSALMTDNIHRPWQAGLLYFTETDIIKSILKTLDKTGLNIGRNQPYNIQNLNTGAIAIHGQDNGCDNCVLEIRDDEFNDLNAGVNKWCAIIKEALQNG